MSCECSSQRKDEDRIYTITVKSYIAVDACCEEAAENADWKLEDADDYEIIDIEEA